jgi:hypothetical protein
MTRQRPPVRRASTTRSERMELSVNGVHQNVDADPNMPLLWAVRDLLVHGTKFGCGVGACGACTIHVDGVAMRSCVASLADAQGKSVTTIEGLGRGRRASCAASVESRECTAVRLLPARPDDAGRVATQTNVEAERRADR